MVQCQLEEQQLHKRELKDLRYQRLGGADNVPCDYNIAGHCRGGDCFLAPVGLRMRMTPFKSRPRRQDD